MALIGLALEGYGWLPNRFRRTTGPLVRTRLMGLPVVALRGPEATRFFYDERNVRRHGAIPEPVRGTLFGKDAVHTLDGADHRRRKALFRELMTPDRAAALAREAAAAWDAAAPAWTGRPVVLFDEASRVITRAVTRWAGVPAHDVPDWAADLVALVDGFAAAGPRHWRARRARGRRERELADLVRQVRAGRLAPAPGTAFDAFARHPELAPELAAVEVLNVVRPTVAVAWFMAFAGHALYRWPEHRVRLGDPAYAEAFAHELRRFYPFAPFIGGRAARDVTWRGERVRAGTMVLLDIFGQNHDAALWPDPYAFRPERFLDRPPGRYDLIPQGGGDSATGHRCPGEPITVALLRTLVPRLAALEYDVPEQDLRISLRRVPARPASGVVIRTHARERAAAAPSRRS